MTHPHKASRKWPREYRLAYGQVIPPEARVNPDEFPEEEYPVYCPDCDYLLRGLPDNHCCPECGRPFERGRLLVEQYVLRSLTRFNDRSINKRLEKVFAIAGFILFGIGWIPIFVYPFFEGGTTVMNLFDRLIPICLGLVAAGISLMLISMIRPARRRLVFNRYRETVFKAIDKSNPIYQEAQIGKWKSLLIPYLIGMPLLIYFVYDFVSSVLLSFAYYEESPRQLLIPCAVALLFAIPMGIVMLIQKHKRTRR